MRQEEKKNHFWSDMLVGAVTFNLNFKLQVAISLRHSRAYTFDRQPELETAAVPFNCKLTF